MLYIIQYDPVYYNRQNPLITKPDYEAFTLSRNEQPSCLPGVQIQKSAGEIRPAGALSGLFFISACRLSAVYFDRPVRELCRTFPAIAVNILCECSAAGIHFPEPA